MTDPTTDQTVERVAAAIHDRQCGCEDYQEYGDEDESYVHMARAGLAALRGGE